MKFFVGLLLGFGMGVATGLILAPQSGESIRTQLGEQGIMLRDRSTGLGDELRARASEAFAQGSEIYSRTKDELNDRYNKAKSGNL